MIDPAQLRTTLDALRSALNSAAPPLMGPAAGSLAHDGSRIVASLRDVLSRLDSADLKGKNGFVTVANEYRSEQQASRLRDLFNGLQAGLRQRVLTLLGPRKIDLAAQLLASQTPDLLRILGREDDENAHSDLIAWLLSPRRAPAVAPYALRSIAAHLDEPATWRERIAEAVTTDSLSVRREYVIARELAGSAGDLARVDIVLTAPGLVLAIENKVWSREHSEQTRTYWRWMECISGLRGGIFLSPSGLSAVEGRFRALSYLDLVSCLLEAAACGAPISAAESIVLGSYLKTLARGIIPVEMRAVRELGRVT